MTDAIFFILLGGYISLIAFEKVQASKNSEKNQEWLEKYGKFLKIAGPSLIILGIVRFVMDKF